MAADLESEETCSPNEERVCGSQWPNAPISCVQLLQYSNIRSSGNTAVILTEGP